MNRIVTAVAAAAGLALFGCPAETLLSVQDQESIQKAQTAKSYFLRQSFFVGPFFSYDDRLYVSERGLDERVLIESMDGEPILPASPLAVIPFGTRVKITSIEFPTSSVVTGRRLKSPRHFTWVYLEIDGLSQPKPLVLVLTHEMRSPQDFDKALANYLAGEDPRPAFAKLAPEVLAAIDAKNVLAGMRWDALLRSRGHPDRVERSTAGQARVEKWFYSPQRWVLLEDDTVKSSEGFPQLELPQWRNPPAPQPAS